MQYLCAGPDIWKYRIVQIPDIRSNPPSYLLMMCGYVMVHGLLQDLDLVAALADHLSDV